MLLRYSAIVLMILTLHSSTVMSQNSNDTEAPIAAPATLLPDVPKPSEADVPKPGIVPNADSNDVTETKTNPTTEPTRAPTSKSPATQPPLIHKPDTTQPPPIHKPDITQPSTSLNTKMNSSPEPKGKSGVCRPSAGLLLPVVILLGIKLMV